ncbi:MAG TPA: POTRA domain-containing protein, partial [Ferruginibacter sp.]|nr:POTRA domain-containing protein [Ferruginibacter sp.]
MLIPVLLVTGIFFSVTSKAQENKNIDYKLQIKLVSKDSAFNLQALKLQTSFTSKSLCTNYISGIITLLSSKGYPTASVDSIIENENSTLIHLFLGHQYYWINLQTDSVEKAALTYSRFQNKDYNGKLLNIPQLNNLQQKILTYYTNNGYPFAQVYLDSIKLNEEKMEAKLKVNKGQVYYIDSI